MEVILLERVAKLGQMGEVVRVKDGFARNYLLPKGKALRATEANKSKFEGMKVDLHAKNVETKGEADKIGSKLNGKAFPVIRQASDQCGSCLVIERTRVDRKITAKLGRLAGVGDRPGKPVKDRQHMSSRRVLFDGVQHVARRAAAVDADNPPA